jgi:tRNA (Thr-GGU) A37 N-methylase
MDGRTFKSVGRTIVKISNPVRKSLKALAPFVHVVVIVLANPTEGA